MSSPGTTIVAVKRALRDGLALRPALQGVLVNYGDPGDRGRREQIWMGRIQRADQEPVALRQGRRKRDEDYDLWVHIDVASKVTPEDNEARAIEIVQEVESLLADDPSIGNVPGVLWAVVSQMRLNTVETADGPSTSAIVTVNVRGRLL
jgi:hypothetical protein